MIKFEKGKFYMNDFGKAIAVHERVNTYAWGGMLIVEEAIPTGKGVEHYCSCILDTGMDCEDSWTEIGQQEFLGIVNKYKKDDQLSKTQNDF